MNALQQVEKSADNNDVFYNEMSTYYRLLDRRNVVPSTEITFADPTEREEHNNLIQ